MSSGGYRRRFAALVVFALLAVACGTTDVTAESVDSEAVDAAPANTPATEPEAADSTDSSAPSTAAPQPAPEIGQITVYLQDDRYLPTDSSIASSIEDLVALTPEFFTESTGITVEFETYQTARDLWTCDGCTADVLLIDSFESPQFGGGNEWLEDLTPRLGADRDDFFTSVLEANSHRGQLFAIPMVAESSVLMINSSLLESAGIETPVHPSWAEIAEIASDSVLGSDGLATLCLRGDPGWSNLGASLTTVVNTFGGTWWEVGEQATVGAAQINQPDSGFRAATEFYVELLQDAGLTETANTNFGDCFDAFQNGEVVMWYDTTYAAALLEAEGSPLAGGVAYAFAPTELTETSGALRTWGFSIPTDDKAENPDLGWEFIRWATSQEFAQLAAEQHPSRTVELAVSAPFSFLSYLAIANASQSLDPVIRQSIEFANPANPGTTPRPGFAGLQYVGLPQFQGIATQCTEEISSAIAGDITVDEALDRCQEIASVVEGTDDPARR